MLNNDRPTEARGDFSACGIAFRAVYAIMFFGLLGAVSTAAQPTMSLPALQPHADLSEARNRDPSDASLHAPLAGFTPIYQPAPAGGGTGAPSLSEELFQRLPVSENFEAWDTGRDYAARPHRWVWQRLPDGVIYSSYLAGPKEPRFGMVFNHIADSGWVWDLEAGGRVAILRYGSKGPHRPEGWELDVEGAAFPRLDLEHEQDLISTDYRVGVPLTYGVGPFQAKLAVYHLSSHLGDEYLERFPETERINYSRDALVLGSSYYATDDLRLYGETEWAFYTDGGTEPWKFQFGLEYNSVQRAIRPSGSPFLALHAQLREEVDYGGTFVAQAGWQWQGVSNHVFRLGVQYSGGKSDQYQFYRRNEEKIGIGAWYDF